MTTRLEPRAPLLSMVLSALYDAGLRTRPADAGSLARALGVSPVAVGRALVKLEADGLVDASRARLTLRGLALAAGLAAGRRVPARVRAA